MNSKKRVEPRTYRELIKPGHLTSFNVAIAESDLHVSAEVDLTADAYDELARCRQTLEDYIASSPAFLTSLSPLDVPAEAPQLVRTMSSAAQRAGVGPMAAVAGAIAETVGRRLLACSSEVIVENGGDIFLRTLVPRKALIYAGDSPFSLRVALQLPPYPNGLGLCTSAGTVGHSLSFGKADAVVILAPDTALADAWATAIGNVVKTTDDIEPALERAAAAKGLIGAVIVVGDALGAWGEVQLGAP